MAATSNPIDVALLRTPEHRFLSSLASPCDREWPNVTRQGEAGGVKGIYGFFINVVVAVETARGRIKNSSGKVNEWSSRAPTFLSSEIKILPVHNSLFRGGG
jgi:hypothetical protein